VIGEGIYYRLFPIFKEYFRDSVIETRWDYNWWVFDTGNDIKYCYEWRYPDKVIELNQYFHWFLTYDWRERHVKYVAASIDASDLKEAFSLNAYCYNKGRLTKKNENFWTAAHAVG